MLCPAACPHGDAGKRLSEHVQDFDRPLSFTVNPLHSCDSKNWERTHIISLFGKIINLLKERFNVIKFQPQPIPEKVLHEILESGRLSPAGENQQPWRFGVTTDPDMINKIASLAYHQAWLARAPLLSVLGTVFVDDEKAESKTLQ